MCVCVYFHVRLFGTPWTVVCQAPLSMGFFRQVYWSGLPFPPGDLPNPGIELAALTVSPALQADSFTAEPLGKPRLTIEKSIFLKARNKKSLPAPLGERQKNRKKFRLLQQCLWEQSTEPFQFSSYEEIRKYQKSFV